VPDAFPRQPLRETLRGLKETKLQLDQGHVRKDKEQAAEVPGLGKMIHGHHHTKSYGSRQPTHLAEVSGHTQWSTDKQSYRYYKFLGAVKIYEKVLTSIFFFISINI